MTTLRIDLSDLRELKLSLERLHSKVSDLTPMMRQVGAKLLDTTLERFETMSGPDWPGVEAALEGVGEAEAQRGEKILRPLPPEAQE